MLGNAVAKEEFGKSDRHCLHALHVHVLGLEEDATEVIPQLPDLFLNPRPDLFPPLVVNLYNSLVHRLELIGISTRRSKNLRKPGIAVHYQHSVGPVRVPLLHFLHHHAQQRRTNPYCMRVGDLLVLEPLSSHDGPVEPVHYTWQSGGRRRGEIMSAGLIRVPVKRVEIVEPRDRKEIDELLVLCGAERRVRLEGREVFEEVPVPRPRRIQSHLRRGWSGQGLLGCGKNFPPVPVDHWQPLLRAVHLGLPWRACGVERQGRGPLRQQAERPVACAPHGVRAGPRGSGYGGPGMSPA
mmetsp:Transcript_96193/g.272093  ORF Transcript_96193/g.272093 Transcript_96193/m.272093 type:complete len:296 (-) Transcript_96193:27-914(-)